MTKREKINRAMSLALLALGATGCLSSPDDAAIGDAVLGDSAPNPIVDALPGPGTDVTILRDIVTSDDARFPEADPALLDVVVEPDAIELRYDGEPSVALEVGHVITGAREGGYLRRITSVEEVGPDRKSVV